MVPLGTLYYPVVHGDKLVLIGTLWYLLKPCGTLSYGMVHCGTQWYTLVPCSTPLYPLVHCGKPWYTVVPLGTQ